MEIRQMRLFLAVCEHTSMTQAAQCLHISQQALSSSIASLEEKLGVRLFRRSNRGMVLTDAGASLRALMTPVLQQYDDALHSFSRRYNNSRGDIRLALAPGILRSIAPDLLLRFAEAYPDIHVNVVEAYDTECPELVLNGEADFALTPETFGGGDVKYVNLKTEPLYAILHKRHPLAMRESVSLLDLKDEQFVSLDEKHRIYQCTLRACEKYGYVPNLRQLSKDVGFLLSLVREKDCVFICVGHVLNELAHDYVTLSLDDEEMDWRIGFVFRKNEKPSAIVDAFYEFVKDIIEIRI